jgi:hypothetical protein
MKDIKSLTHLRSLDIDDLIILCLIGQGYKYADIARALFIGNAAISHRLKKYKTSFPGFEIEYTGNKTVQNDRAVGVFAIAKQVLDELLLIGQIIEEKN